MNYNWSIIICLKVHPSNRLPGARNDPMALIHHKRGTIERPSLISWKFISRPPSVQPCMESDRKCLCCFVIKFQREKLFSVIVKSSIQTSAYLKVTWFTSDLKTKQERNFKPTQTRLFFILGSTKPPLPCYYLTIGSFVFLGLLCNRQVSTVLCESLVSKELLREKKEVREEKEWEGGQNDWTNDPYWIDSKM